MRQQKKYKDRRLSVVIIAVCTMITFPMLMIPVGLRESTPPGVLVGRAYADAYPYSDQEDEKLVEDWALPANTSDTTDPDVDPDADPTADPSADPDATNVDPDATGEDNPTEPEGPDEPLEPDTEAQTVD
ncbi:MAG: hypothetical protein IKH92_10040, partial [Clostridiales bacterium]|nr:hypothetical protein [Clostridiales bacterium]